MTKLNITLSDEVTARLQARAAESGFDGVEAYVASLAERDAAPQVLEDDDLEQLLLQRLDKDESVDLTPEFVTQFKEQVAQRRTREANP